MDHVTLPPKGSFASNGIFRPKISKEATIKTKSETVAFFYSPPFLPLALCCSPFLFLHYRDFGASRALRRLFNEMTAKMVRLVFKNSATYTQHEMWNFTSLSDSGGNHNATLH